MRWCAWDQAQAREKLETLDDIRAVCCASYARRHELLAGPIHRYHVG